MSFASLAMIGVAKTITGVTTWHGWECNREINARDNFARTPPGESAMILIGFTRAGFQRVSRRVTLKIQGTEKP